MADIERIAMVLSKSSKTVADWKLKFPILQDTMKVKLASEMEKVNRKKEKLFIWKLWSLQAMKNNKNIINLGYHSKQTPI